MSSTTTVDGLVSGMQTTQVISQLMQVAAQPQVSTAVMDPAGTGTTGAGIDLTIGSTTTHLDPATDSPQGVADAINKAKLGVSAALVNTTQGTVLQLTGSTGTANAFSVAG